MLMHSLHFKVIGQPTGQVVFSCTAMHQFNQLKIALILLFFYPLESRNGGSLLQLISFGTLAS